jgi:hypothetical protein
MALNLVTNNAGHNFAAQADAKAASFDQPKVVPTPGTDASQVAKLRAQLESGTLTSAGSGINAEYSA